MQPYVTERPLRPQLWKEARIHSLLHRLNWVVLDFMDEKSAAMGTTAPISPTGHQQANMTHTRPRRSRKYLLGLLSVVLPFYIIFSLLPSTRRFIASSTSQTSHISTAAKTNHSLVPFEAHIMSKCPDARDCLRDLVVPAMEQVVDKVNFTLSFIGS